MKRYIPVVVGIVALCAVLYIGDSQMKKHDSLAEDEQKSEVSFKSFQGSVTRQWEGTTTLEYGFDLPETSTTTVERDGALVKVAEGTMPVMAMYVSFEGARGFSPADYVSNIIVPQVSAVTDMGTTTIGDYDWTVVASEWSEWHIAPTSDGKWLLVVENKKADSDKAKGILETISAN